MKAKDFDFKLEPGLIPHAPNELRGRHRDSGRMIVLDRTSNAIAHVNFSSICDYLRAGDLLVLNDSYVVPNMLLFRHGEGTAWVIICGHEPGRTSIAAFRPVDIPVPGLSLIAAEDDQLRCRVLSPLPRGLWSVAFEPADRLALTLEQHGQRYGGSTDPAGPAAQRANTASSSWRSSPEAYRSVYAKSPGSLQIPSAGLHFSEALLDRLTGKGVEIAHITLHVGATELLSVRRIAEQEVEDHKVRPEFFTVEPVAAAQLDRALTEKRRIVAVGTTVLRTLETLGLSMARDAAVRPQTGWTDLYVYPGFEFKIVDALLTNLHRPRSTHLVLTAAFAGYDLVMKSYAEMIVAGGYEFDMFGDSMLIV
ncbi:S-adenosylmethionine tRNA ribosyltransferase [Trinickia symbiotica]|uniref:S-adenosylmethionine tRNA ribosyltransferase n=1 Tax=Trinickia symbiotica TaxID=863227 RepID=A0A2T3XLS8_9BURK|nr:S-adenosylmethionine:tRNA ribosyltransferase-isomerase [Trinickia symbiotica]PTB17481.1 S-adenosylmethionine tRNA ribosyltransferase [Trinickia symbiotica]